MLDLRKPLLILFLVLFFAIQWKLTIFGGFLWPFSSHRLFSQQAPLKKTIVSAVVSDRDGNIQYVHPGRVIPIEYARCSGLVRNLVKAGSQAQKEAFQQYLLNRLNSNPWWAFDEMYASVRSPTNAPFTSIHFEEHELDFSAYCYPDPVPVTTTRRILP